jgi:transposase
LRDGASERFGSVEPAITAGLALRYDDVPCFRARRRARGRGKSDSIDAIAVARAALREGSDVLPAAQLEGPELDLRLLVDHRERLVRQRVALNNTLQWHLHDIWPELRLPGSSLFYGTGGPRVARRLGRTEPTTRRRIARDELRRIRSSRRP